MSLAAAAAASPSSIHFFCKKCRLIDANLEAVAAGGQQASCQHEWKQLMPPQQAQAPVMPSVTVAAPPKDWQYDHLTRMPKEKIAELRGILAADEPVPTSKERERNRLLNQLEVLYHVADNADHVEAGTTGCLLTFQKYLVEDVRMHMSGASAAATAFAQTKTRVEDLLGPLPPPPKRDAGGGAPRRDGGQGKRKPWYGGQRGRAAGAAGGAAGGSRSRSARGGGGHRGGSYSGGGGDRGSIRGGGSRSNA